jgi:glycosyltransferase involved in cell wall biosynthesis
LISVVVCTHNRAGILERMMTSFYAQEGLDRVAYELIIVDNRSTDNTVDVVEKFTGRRGLEYVYEAKQGHTFARNRGIKEARGDIVAFLDDDVLLDPGWLEAMEAAFDETTADIVGGKAYLIFESPAPPWLGPEFRKALSEVDLGEKRKDAGDGQRLYGLNIAFRKKRLEAQGGFDESLGRRGEQVQGGDEQELVSRIVRDGGTCLYEPKALVGHLITAERMRWAYFVRLAEASAGTRTRLDFPATLPIRLKRFAETSAKLGYYGGQLPVRLLLGRNRYGYRNCVNQVIRARVQWPGRFRRVFLPHEGRERTWFTKR